MFFGEKKKMRAFCSQIKKKRIYPKLLSGFQKWTFINVQNRKTFFQFGTVKCRSLETNKIIGNKILIK